jgi:putative N6-adenine-specific DNA methylase
MPGSFDCFAACQPGLEPLLVGELQALELKPRALAGGAAFHAKLGPLLRAGLWLGTASHVLVRIAEFHCRALGELQRKAAELPWRDWLRPQVPVSIQATTKASRVYHTGAAEERVHDAIAAAFGKPPFAAAATDDVVARVHVRFRDNVCTLSLDTTSSPLHRRGYRLDGRKAPLREDLAHALVLASGWVPGDALLDPFGGSGTIAIEAAALALGLAPGRLRPPPLHHLAPFDVDVWDTVRTAPGPRPTVVALAPGEAPRCMVGDRDAGAVAAARENAARAGVAEAITFHHGAITTAPWLQPAAAPPRGALVTNPPFGVRVPKANDLLPLYQTLGHRAARLPEGWRLAILAHDVRLARRTGLPLRAAFTTRHGGLAVTALVGTIGAASTPPSPAPAE